MSKIAWASSPVFFFFFFLGVGCASLGARTAVNNLEKEDVFFFWGGHIKIMVSPALSGTCGIWVFLLLFSFFFEGQGRNGNCLFRLRRHFDS